MGTVVDINRVEGDDLALTPDVDPEQLRDKMAKTGDLEAQVFAKLFELSERAEGILTAEQRMALQELKRRQTARALRDGAHAGPATGPRPPAHGPARFDFFLDQIGALRLSEAQVGQLAALKDETRKAILLDQARLKGLELDLLAQVHRLDGRTDLPPDQLAAMVRALESRRAKITETRLQAYHKARQILTPEQRSRVPPAAALLNGP